MGREVVRRKQARRDVLKHFIYLAEHADIKTMHRLVDAIGAACKFAAEIPKMGPKPDFASHESPGCPMWNVRINFAALEAFAPGWLRVGGRTRSVVAERPQQSDARRSRTGPRDLP